MKQNGLASKLLTRHNRIRIILLVLGFTLFPAIVYWGEELLFPTSQTLSEFYGKIYGSLMDWGMDGMFAWCVVCTPYLVFDIYLIVKDLRTQPAEAGKS